MFFRLLELSDAIWQTSDARKRLFGTDSLIRESLGSDFLQVWSLLNPFIAGKEYFINLRSCKKKTKASASCDEPLRKHLFTLWLFTVVALQECLYCLGEVDVRNEIRQIVHFIGRPHQNRRKVVPRKPLLIKMIQAA